MASSLSASIFRAYCSNCEARVMLLHSAMVLYAAAAITLVGLLVSWLYAPETRALSLQEAAALE